MKRENLFFALNETTHALRFAQAAASRFRLDPDEIEESSATAVPITFISNRLADSQANLLAAKDEISRLIEKNESV